MNRKQKRVLQLKKVEAHDTELVGGFVASFSKFDDMQANEILDPIAWELAYGETDECGHRSWKPLQVLTDPSALEGFYGKIPNRLPPLYEQLVLSHRWAEVELGKFRLSANPPSPDLTRLASQILKDKGLAEMLIPNGYIQFGRGPDVNYDPVCFDTRRRSRDGDCRVVQIDHEEILCNHRIKEVKELFPTFRDLLLSVIEQAKTEPSKQSNT